MGHDDSGEGLMRHIMIVFCLCAPMSWVGIGCARDASPEVEIMHPAHPEAPAAPTPPASDTLEMHEPIEPPSHSIPE